MPAIIAKIYSRWQTKAVNGAKITRGHINRTINYVLEHTPEKDRPRVLGGQGFEYAITDEETARRAGRDMEGLSDQGPPYPPGPRPNPLLHISLSLPRSENPSDDHMVESVRSALRALGTERAWGVFVRHHDTEHHHVHFVGSRIDPETRSTFAALRGYNRDRPKMLEWARGYEREHELKRERKQEMTRLYRVEPLHPGNEDNLAPWLRESDEFKKIREVTGRWFAADRENVNWYIEHSRKDGIEHQVTYVDLPRNDAERYRVSNLADPEGDEARSYSRRPEEEFFLPREMADRRQKIDWQEYQRELERTPERNRINQMHENLRQYDLEREQRTQEIENQRLHDPGYGYSNSDDALKARRSWLKTPENFREFADAHGLGRVSPQEAEKLKNDHANERMLSDFNYFNKLEKPDRAPAMEHQHEPSEGMPFYSPLGAKMINKWADPGEVQHQRQQLQEVEPAEKIALKKDRRERGGGRERSIFDDGSMSGESGYGGD